MRDILNFDLILTKEFLRVLFVIVLLMTSSFRCERLTGNGFIINKVCDNSIKNGGDNLEVSCNSVALMTSLLQRANHDVAYDSVEARACLWPLTNQMAIPEVGSGGLSRVTYGGTLQAIADLMTYWGFDNTLIIMDQSQGTSPELVSRFFLSRGLPVRVRLVAEDQPIRDDDDLKMAIVSFRYLVLWSGSNTTEAVLSAASQHSPLFELMHNWIVVMSEARMRRLRHQPFARMLGQRNSQMGVLVPTLGHQFQFSAKMFGHRKNFEKETGIGKVEMAIPKIRDCANSSTVYIEIPAQDKESVFHRFVSNADIYDVFRSPLTNETEFIRFAVWSARGGLRYLSLREANLSRDMLRQRRLRVVPFPLIPYTILDKSRTKIEGGYLPEIFFSIGKHLNFRYDIQFTNDSTFGIETNRSFSGFVGRVQRGEVDMAFSVVSLLQPRKRILHYGALISRGYVTMCLPRPDSTVPPTIYVMPFSAAVWLSMLPALLCLMGALLVITVISPDNSALRRYLRKPARFLLWFLSGEFLEQAFISPPGWAGKAVFYTLLSATLVTFTYYSSILTSLLTYREERLPFNTLQEMVTNKNYKVLLVKQSMHQTIFEKASDDIFKRVWQKVVKEGRKGLVQGFTEGYYHMLTGKYVYICDGPSTQYLARSNCRVAFTGAKYLKEYFHIAIAKTFPYAKLFSNDLYRLLEGGIIQRLEAMYLRSNQEACKQGTETRHLELAQVIPLFLFLTAAVVLAIVTLLCEICVDARLNDRL